jgi:hypothetical protein
MALDDVGKYIETCVAYFCLHYLNARYAYSPGKSLPLKDNCPKT